MRIFGSNHLIRENTVFNIADPDDPGNIDPHADCIQSWDLASQGSPIITDTIIENNFFSVSHSSGKGIMTSVMNGGTCHDLIIRNNIFEFSDIGISAYTTAGIGNEYKNIFVTNNLFKAKFGGSSWGTSVYFKDIENFTYINNITVDCHPQHRKIIGKDDDDVLDGVIDYNIAWNSDGSIPTLTPALQANELRGVDPEFEFYTGIYGENNYHLKKTSPAIDKGFFLDLVTIDYDGNSRPLGLACDIGPYESTEGE